MTVKRITEVCENDEGLEKHREKRREEIQRKKRTLKWFKRLVKERIQDLIRY